MFPVPLCTKGPTLDGFKYDIINHYVESLGKHSMLQVGASLDVFANQSKYTVYPDKV